MQTRLSRPLTPPNTSIGLNVVLDLLRLEPIVLDTPSSFLRSASRLLHFIPGVWLLAYLFAFLVRFLKKANSTRLDDCDAHNVCCLLLLSSFTISFYHRFVTLISIQVFGFAFIICYCFIFIDCCFQQSIKIKQWSVAGAQQAKGFFLHWGFGPILDIYIYIYCVAFFSFHLEGSLFFVLF